MFNKGDIIALADNNKYTVVDKYTNGSNTYVYLVNFNDVNKFIFGKLENDEIVELTDPEELESVIQQVNKNLRDNLN